MGSASALSVEPELEFRKSFDDAFFFTTGGPGKPFEDFTRFKAPGLPFARALSVVGDINGDGNSAIGGGKSARGKGSRGAGNGELGGWEASGGGIVTGPVIGGGNATGEMGAAEGPCALFWGDEGPDLVGGYPVDGDKGALGDPGATAANLIEDGGTVSMARKGMTNRPR